MSNAPVLRFGSHGMDKEQFLFPSSVACNAKGDIIVVDEESDKLKVFDKHGKYSFDVDCGAQTHPVCVAVDHKNDNEIVVADSSRRLIQIFNELGKYLRSFGLEEGSESFKPRAIAVNQSDELYYVVDSQRIRMFNRFGGFQKELKTSVQIRHPFGIGILSNGDVVISEPPENRLRVFTSRGNFVREIGQGQLSSPHHLYVDFEDNIWVADSGNNQVKAFNQEGDLLKVIGDGMLVSPYGVYMDNRARIVASEWGASKAIADPVSRISIFRPSPELWTTGTVIWWIGTHKDLDSTVCNCAKKYSWNGSTLLDLYDEYKKGAASFVATCSDWGISDGPTRMRLKWKIKKLFEDA